MADETYPLPKAQNYNEHYSEFITMMPTPMNKDMISMHFMSTAAIPVIKKRSENTLEKEVTVEVQMKTELQHVCSVFFPKSQLVELKKSIEQALKEIGD